MLKAKPKLNYHFEGIGKLSKRHWYPAVHATNQPDWKEKGKIFIHAPADIFDYGCLLEYGEYELKDEA